MSHSGRQERRPDQKATTVLLMMVLVLSLSGLDSRPTRPGGLPGPGTNVHHDTPPLAEVAMLPGCGLLPPPSETLASVGARSGTAVTVDLSHLAGSELELERSRRNLPPPHRA
jgi:hypothetical protein